MDFFGQQLFIDTVFITHLTDVALKKEPGATFIPQNAKNHCAVKRGPRYRSKLRLNQDSELYTAT